MMGRQKERWATPEALDAHRNRQCLPDLIGPVCVARMVLFLAPVVALTFRASVV